MPQLRIRGFTGLPIVIILSVLLGTVALGLGMRSFEQTKRLTLEQRSIQSFYRLVEASTEVSYGNINDEKLVKLDLPNSRIKAEGNLICLKSNDEIKKAETLPLPLRKEFKDNFTMKSGTFLLKLEHNTSNLGTTGGDQIILRVRKTD